MAELRKHPQSRFFSARFYDADGRQLTRSTKCTNRREAMKVAIAFEEAARTKRTARQVRAVISELHQAVTGETLRAQSFRVFSEAWTDRKAPEVKPATISFYKNAIVKFLEFLGPKAESAMTEISADDIVRFRNLEAKTLSPKTVNHDIKCLRMIFRDALRDRLISESPCEFVAATKKTPTIKRQPFTIPQLEAVIAIADDEWKSLIRMGLYTGQRLGDLAALTWRNIDLAKKQVRLVQQKTGKPVIIPLTLFTVDELKARPDKNDIDAPLHPRAYASWLRTGKTATLSNQFVGLLAKVGIREKKPHRKTPNNPGRGSGSSKGGLSFHSLRTTLITLGEELGIPKAVIMAIAGHESEEMSQHYTNVGVEALESAIAKIPSI
jgi:integrase